MTYSEEFLEHYGVRGMKWGVRRTRSQLSSSRSKRDAKKASRAASEDTKRHAKNRSRGTKALSDSELRELVNRMNMEQNYGRMNKGKVAKGTAKIAAILAVGKTVNDVIAFVDSPAGQFLNAAIGNAIPTSRAVSVIGKTEKLKGK